MRTLLTLIACSLFLISCDNEILPNLPEDASNNPNNITEVFGIERPADAYNYPVVPGMPEWAEFKSSEEMIKGCQIPKQIANNLSTDALVCALLEFPLAHLVVHRSQLVRDFSSIEELTCYQELVKRADAGTCLIQYYKKMPVDPEDVSANMLKAPFYVLCAQKFFVSQYSHQDKNFLIKHILEYAEPVQLGCRDIPWYLAGRILEHDNYLTGEEDIIRTMNDTFMYPEIFERIKMIAERYVKL